MNKKGFTLIELLGVIVILGVLVLIVTVSVQSVLKTSKESLSKTQIKNIEEAAKAYYLKYGIDNSYQDKDEVKACINVSTLISEGYLEAEVIKNPEDSSEMIGSVKVIYKANNYSYKYQDDECSKDDLGIICEPVTESTKTTGNVPQGNFNPGDEYICEVKEGTEYHFFVLGRDENDYEKINLIMNRNICDNGELATEENKCTVAWYSSGLDYDKYDKGPVTAMTYLHNATKDWTNIPNMIMDYEDENILYSSQVKGTKGYGSIKTINNITTITDKEGNVTATYENLKARLPKYNEVHGAGKCLTSAENENQNGSCPLWLVDYLYSSKYYTEGKTNIAGIYGYWTLSSHADFSTIVWDVYYDGSVRGDDVNSDGYTGSRPVITVLESDVSE